MADARFPGRWINDRRVMGLEPVHFKCFVVSLAWSVENRTDGVILLDDLDFIPRFDASSVTAFVAGGLWLETSANEWLIAEYAVTQTTKSEFVVLENARKREREKKARQRQRGRDAANPVPRDVPGDMSPGTAQDRQGQARTGKRLPRAASSSDLEQQFNRAYIHWPKKVERKKSLTAFEKAARTHNAQSLVDDIIRFGDAYASSTETRFVPSLCAWLNGERWTDELPEPPIPSDDEWNAFLSNTDTGRQSKAAVNAAEYRRLFGDPTRGQLCRDGHMLVADGTCALCEFRPLKEVSNP